MFDDSCPSNHVYMGGNYDKSKQDKSKTKLKKFK